MFKFLKNIFYQILNLIAPERADAMLVRNLKKEDIFDLPKAPAVENMSWISPLFHYKNNAVKAIVWELKYRENTSPLETIGQILYDEIVAQISDIVLFDNDAKFLLIPIPISKQTRIDRGYNQSELIAKSILQYDLEHIMTYAPQYLEKIKDTPKQSRSGSRQDRMKNLAGCFEADPRVENFYVILIDDVVTTGSTLSEARTTLLSAGARNIYAFTIAH